MEKLKKIKHLIILLALIQAYNSLGQSNGRNKLALTPPMGWNSWDCFGPSVTEEEVRANAEYMEKELKECGWEYIVIDMLWYGPDATSHDYQKVGVNQLIDKYGRVRPAANKFPSASKDNSFKPLADYLHSKGLKFGLHIMRGIPRQAVEKNTPIHGTKYRARDIVNYQDTCTWYKGTFGIDMKKPGAQEYYNSIAKLFAEWGVDYVKADDLGWPTYRADEIHGIRQALTNCGRPIVLSISPGVNGMNTKHLYENAHLWRISGDFWDSWAKLKNQFDICKIWAPHTGPGHWADADMLPMGTIGIRAEVGEARKTNFTWDEQRTMITLWSIFRSPLMFGGNLPDNDDSTRALITSKEVLEVNKNSTNNKELYRKDSIITWIADVPGSKDRYFAVFNTDKTTAEVSINFKELGINSEKLKIRDLWLKKDVGTFVKEFNVMINPHGANLYRISSQ